MDPRIVAENMRDITLSRAERADAAQAYLDWIDRGGFVTLPRGLSLGGNTAARFYVRNECVETLRALNGPARNGWDRCGCGSKYWTDDDTCVDCGAPLREAE